MADKSFEGNQKLKTDKFQFVEQIKTAPIMGAVLLLSDIQEITPKCFSASMMAASFSSGQTQGFRGLLWLSL